MQVVEVSKPDLGLDESLNPHISMFSELVVRDFLRSKGLDRTLACLTEELESRGDKAPDLDGWCSMGKLLELPELLNANSCFSTILEVLVKELTRETNVKMRRPVTLTMKTVPKCASMSQLPVPEHKPRVQRKPMLPERAASSPGRRAPPPKMPPKFVMREHRDSPFSRENWIPMDKREKMLQRNLQTLKLNLDELDAYDKFVKNEKRHQKLSDLEKTQLAERYGLKKKKACGLCGLNYSDINLVLKVPYKAIQDLRSQWAEIYGDDPRATTHKKPAFTYDEVGVCVFCAQFFRLGQQDVYRPSYEQKVAEKNRKLRIEHEANAKAYWDPVKQLDLERQERYPELAAASCPTSPNKGRMAGCMIPMGPP